MRTRKVLRFVVFLALLSGLGFGCGGEESSGTPADESAGPTEIGVTQALDGASTALKVGHVLRVELPANPLNGYAWEIESVDESVLRVPVEEYLPPLPEEADAPGTSIWRFLAVGPGSTTLKLRYVKFGEDVPTEESTFTFDVLVD